MRLTVPLTLRVSGGIAFLLVAASILFFAVVRSYSHVGYLAAPTNLRARYDRSRFVTLDWKGSARASGYVVHVAGLTYTTSSTSLTLDEVLVRGRSYAWRVNPVIGGTVRSGSMGTLRIP